MVNPWLRGLLSLSGIKGKLKYDIKDFFKVFNYYLHTKSNTFGVTQEIGVRMLWKFL